MKKYIKVVIIIDIIGFMISISNIIICVKENQEFSKMILSIVAILLMCVGTLLTVIRRKGKNNN